MLLEKESEKQKHPAGFATTKIQKHPAGFATTKIQKHPAGFATTKIHPEGFVLLENQGVCVTRKGKLKSKAPHRVCNYKDTKAPRRVCNYKDTPRGVCITKES